MNTIAKLISGIGEILFSIFVVAPVILFVIAVDIIPMPASIRTKISQHLRGGLYG